MLVTVWSINGGTCGLVSSTVPTTESVSGTKEIEYYQQIFPKKITGTKIL